MLAVVIAVRKQSERFADILFVCFQRHFVLRGCQAFKAPDLLIVRDASRHFFGSRAAAGRIDEAIKHIKADLADKGDGLVKFHLRFAGEAADYICRESCIGDFFFDITSLFKVLLTGVAAVHGVQHTGAARLNGKMEMARYLRRRRHYVHKLF